MGSVVTSSHLIPEQRDRQRATLMMIMTTGYRAQTVPHSVKATKRWLCLKLLLTCSQKDFRGHIYLPFSMAFSMATPILSTYDKSRFPPGRLGSPYSVLLTVTVRRRPTDPGEAKKSIIKNFFITGEKSAAV